MRRSRFALSLLTLPLFLILVGLGTWQLERMAWKDELTARLETRITAPPVDLSTALSLPPGELAWRRVEATGRFRDDLEMMLYRTSVDGDPGYHVLTPLQVASDAPGGPVTVLVDRGWVPGDRREPATRDGAPAGEVAVTGVALAPEQDAWYRNENHPETGEWYWLELPAMSRHVGLDLAPFVLIADRAGSGALPVGGQVRIDLPDNHLQYAITWFTLAMALAVIWAVMMVRGNRGETP